MDLNDDRCDCMLHRPPESFDRGDREAIDAVATHGWQVRLVGNAVDQPTDDPEFAYTVGLWHQARHPELFVSGLPWDLMHSMLNNVARRVVSGARLTRHGELHEGVIQGFPVTTEPLSEGATVRMVTWSRWFHRAHVPAVQLVWPDTSGLFPWQHGSVSALDGLQPPLWRSAGPRAGLLGDPPSWDSRLAPDAPAYACLHVTEERESVTYVERDETAEGEEWLAMCADVEHSGTWGEPVTLERLIRGNPAMVQLADLPLNGWASREDLTGPWRTGRLDA